MQEITVADHSTRRHKRVECIMNDGTGTRVMLSGESKPNFCMWKQSQNSLGSDGGKKK